MTLKKYNVTVKRFDPTKGTGDDSAESFVLPVDSPDEEHAASSTLANLISWTPKVSFGSLKQVAFYVEHIEERG